MGKLCQFFTVIWLPHDINGVLLFHVFNFSYYEATVDEILEDGSCTVTFDEYGNTDVTEVREVPWWLGQMACDW